MNPIWWFQDPKFKPGKYEETSIKVKAIIEWKKLEK